MASKMNDKRLDQSFQKKVDHVQKHNGINVFWDKTGVWKKIQKALEDSTGGPKMIAWYSVMAASVSLLVASAVSFANYDLDFLNTTQPEVAELVSEPLNLETPVVKAAVYYASLPADSMIIPVRSRQVLSFQEDATFTVADRLPEKTSKFKSFTRLTADDLAKNKFVPALKFHFAGGLSANSRFITPKVDLGVKINLSRMSDVKKSLFVGSSIQILRNISPEQGLSKRLSKGYFIKTAYENERIENGKRKSWSTGVEYLIHSDDDSLPGNTLKVFYNHSIHGRLKIGPEVMFTKDFKKVYPGITLALG